MKKFITKSLAVLSAICMASLCSCSGKNSESSSEASVAAGEFVTNPDEPDLGAYTVNKKGTKLYYDPEQIAPELMGTLEAYFTAFAEKDYETYISLSYPEYVEKMGEYLKKDYSYGLDTSFKNQCDSLETNAGGAFTVTRVKAEIAAAHDAEGESSTEGKNGAEDYLNSLGELFEIDSFYEKVKAETDELHDLVFYIMAEANGEETVLISEYEIVLAEKDGKYYTFG